MKEKLRLVGGDEKVFEGSTKYLCAECGEREVWIAPSGLKIVAENDVTVVCMSCAAVKLFTDPDEKFGDPTPEQIAELEEYASRDHD